MRIFSVFILLLAFASCSSDNNIPKNVIPVEKMKFIMWDMMRAGELAATQYTKDSSNLKLKTTELFEQVFKIHSIDKNKFYSSYHFYEEHPNMNKILLDSLSAYATRQRLELYKKMH